MCIPPAHCSHLAVKKETAAPNKCNLKKKRFCILYSNFMAFLKCKETKMRKEYAQVFKALDGFMC